MRAAGRRSPSHPAALAGLEPLLPPAGARVCLHTQPCCPGSGTTEAECGRGVCVCVRGRGREEPRADHVRIGVTWLSCCVIVTFVTWGVGGPSGTPLGWLLRGPAAAPARRPQSGGALGALLRSGLRQEMQLDARRELFTWVVGVKSPTQQPARGLGSEVWRGAGRGREGPGALTGWPPALASSAQFAELPSGQEEEAGQLRGPAPGVQAEVSAPEAGSR